MSVTPTPTSTPAPTGGNSLAEGVKTPRAGERTAVDAGEIASDSDGHTAEGERSGGATSPPAG